MCFEAAVGAVGRCGRGLREGEFDNGIGAGAGRGLGVGHGVELRAPGAAALVAAVDGHGFAGEVFHFRGGAAHPHEDAGVKVDGEREERLNGDAIARRAHGDGVQDQPQAAFVRVRAFERKAAVLRECLFEVADRGEDSGVGAGHAEKASVDDGFDGCVEERRCRAVRVEIDDFVQG